MEEGNPGRATLKTNPGSSVKPGRSGVRHWEIWNLNFELWNLKYLEVQSITFRYLLNPCTLYPAPCTQFSGILSRFLVFLDTQYPVPSPQYLESCLTAPSGPWGLSMLYSVFCMYNGMCDWGFTIEFPTFYLARSTLFHKGSPKIMTGEMTRLFRKILNNNNLYYLCPCKSKKYIAVQPIIN